MDSYLLGWTFNQWAYAMFATKRRAVSLREAMDIRLEWAKKGFPDMDVEPVLVLPGGSDARGYDYEGAENLFSLPLPQIAHE